MKAFLSYKFSDNVSEIIKLLKEKEIEIFDSMSDFKTGSSLQQSIIKSVLDCDFIIMVYTSSNPNLAFEAGIAVARNKPIFSIVSEFENDPDFLFDSTYVHATPNEIDKIRFNLDIFLEKIKPRKKSTRLKPHKYFGGGVPNYYLDIHNKYTNLDSKTERGYEYLFKDIFEKYQLNVIQNKFDNNSKFYADFCIWSDKLSNIIGNPILIEIKKEINSKNIINIEKSIEKLISTNSAESCLIFYDYLKDINKRELPNTSKYLFIQISDFIEKLNENDFNDSIRKIRNEIVHKY